MGLDMGYESGMRMGPQWGILENDGIKRMGEYSIDDSYRIVGCYSICAVSQCGVRDLRAQYRVQEPAYNYSSKLCLVPRLHRSRIRLTTPHKENSGHPYCSTPTDSRRDQINGCKLI